jgi:prophage tail gpP-like protein
VQVRIGADVVITGYVDRVVPQLTAGRHAVGVLGRGKCQDLVDCAAEWPGGQIVGSSVLEIARKLAAPYGIGVSSAVDPGDPIPQFNLMRGETPFEIIERLCRFRQLLAYETPRGDLMLSRVGQVRAGSGFAQGVNVENAIATFSMDQRYLRSTVPTCSQWTPWATLARAAT